MRPWSACADEVLMAGEVLLFDKQACGLIELFKDSTILCSTKILERA
jgi:hypothetical protein